MSMPFRKGERYFYFRNSGLQNHSILYYKNGLEGEEKLLLDPNTFSEDGSKSLSMTSVSKDGRYIAYGISQSGSDWDEYFVYDIEEGKKLNDHLKWIKFSDASWLPDGSSFYYSRYPRPSGDEYEDQNQHNKLYLHKLGDDQHQDKLVYEDVNNPGYGFFTFITEDEQYQILGIWSGANDHNLLYYRHFNSDEEFIPIIKEWLSDFSYKFNFGDEFYISTKYNAPNGKLMKFNLSDPSLNHWETVIPENKNVLQGLRIVNKNQWIATYNEDLADIVYVYNLQGNFVKEIELPDLGSVGFSGRWDDATIFYSFSSYLYPNTIYTLDLNSFESTPYWTTNKIQNTDEYILKRKFYSSKDGTKIPMFILHKKDMNLNGENPTYLYGYGGFNGSVSPYFSVSRLTWLELGGVLAFPALRGGGEYGEEWHQAGMLHKKQNVFDDFIYAAEYLIDNQYTSPEKLAIGGGSNGGLLVSACMLQRPDLFTAVDCSVPVTDMLRFHKFTIGWAWVPEYGSSENEEQFNFLIEYSPVHNVKKSEYPSIMISTGDHDDRVVPSHSYKLAAELQHNNKSDSPMLLRVHGKAGHGAGKPTNQVIKEIAETWAFLLFEMGVSI